MPKPMFVWSGSAWVSVATEVESLANFATQSYADNATGSKLIVPTSISVGSGSGSVSTQGKVSFSSASSVSINGCFSSTYDNYLILMKAANSTANQCYMRMRASGTDNTSSNYLYGGIYVRYGTSSAVAGENSSGLTSNGFNVLDMDGNYGFAKIQVFNPFVSTNVTGVIYDQAFNAGGSSNDGYYEAFSGLTSVNTSYDGCTFYAATGNMTGDIRIYGLKNG